ncbi:hypothetical protein AB0L99_37065 [Streptomyces sp. NPDC051954]|uniref:hypothetical protein n=1 Tax=unclassified Streptomyces TaxID=2593676 RepID=UPI00341395F6
MPVVPCVVSVAVGGGALAVPVVLLTVLSSETPGSVAGGLVEAGGVVGSAEDPSGFVEAVVDEVADEVALGDTSGGEEGLEEDSGLKAGRG